MENDLIEWICNMNTLQELQQSFTQFIHTHFNTLPPKKEELLALNSDPSRQQFGDLSSTIPLVLSKLANQPPRQIGDFIIQHFQHQAIDKIELAGPGFLNFFLKPEFFSQLLEELFLGRDKFFKPLELPKERVSIEFVSANPTGPLHLGHGRGGIVGDVLGNVLTFLGYSVTKEFYINDAGSQIKKLALSLIIRCQQQLGIGAHLPEDGYHGSYLIDLAQKCINEFGSQVLEKSEKFFEDYATDHLLKNIRQTLLNYGITFDVWFSEQQLHHDHSIKNVVELLKRKGFLYEKEGALWFSSTQFEDDKDRVVRKATGEWTYVAADIAYLQNKIDRGFTQLIMVLGHDHHSYAVRLETIRKALDIKAPLYVILYQLVKIKEDGQEVRMSKRAGKMITLEDVIETVGTDVARFFYLHRKADAQLEFDIALALKKTDENPLFYIQYAYVRTKSILAKALDTYNIGNITQQDIDGLTAQEHLLIKKIVSLASILDTIATTHQTHLLTYYVLELAHLFHNYYSNNRILDPENLKTTRARLLLIIVLKNIFGLVLDLLGISKPEKM